MERMAGDIKNIQADLIYTCPNKDLRIKGVLKEILRYLVEKKLSFT